MTVQTFQTEPAPDDAADPVVKPDQAAEASDHRLPPQTARRELGRHLAQITRRAELQPVRHEERSGHPHRKHEARDHASAPNRRRVIRT